MGLRMQLFKNESCPQKEIIKYEKLTYHRWKVLKDDMIHKTSGSYCLTSSAGWMELSMAPWIHQIIIKMAISEYNETT